MKDDKHYNLSLPEDLYEQLKLKANKRGTTVLELIKKFIKLGLMLLDSEEKNNGEFILIENGKEKRIIIT